MTQKVLSIRRRTCSILADGAAGSTEQRAVVEGCAAAADSNEDGRSEREATSADGRSDAMDLAHRRAVAGSTVCVWPLAVGLHAVFTLVAIGRVGAAFRGAVA